MIKKLALSGYRNYHDGIVSKINEIIDWCNEVDGERFGTNCDEQKEMKAWKRVEEEMKKCHCGKNGHALNSVNCPVHGASYAPEGYVSPEQVAEEIEGKWEYENLHHHKPIIEVLSQYVITLRKKD